MKHWETIQQHAMLGTARAPFTIADLPAAIAGELAWTPLDAEEDFLRLASVAWQYGQTGGLPPAVSAVNSAAVPEEKPYCPLQATGDLQSLVEDELYTLVRVWLQYCQAAGQLARPEILPALLDMAVRRPELRPMIMAVAGNRGRWLMRLNPAWRIDPPAEDDDTVWQTGKPEARRALLAGMRQTDAARALVLLQSTWATESVADKVAFLNILQTHAAEADLPWIESLQEKGQKVTAAITNLLKHIPGSKIVAAYQDVLRQAFALRTGKALLGMLNKTSVAVEEAVAVPAGIFTTGIEKLSSDKRVTDQQYILIQLAMAVPPAFWQTHLQQADARAVITLLQKEQHTALYLPALADAAATFRDLVWVRALLDHGDEALLDSAIVLLLRALPVAERMTYAARFLKQQPQGIIALLLEQDEPWDLALAKNIIAYTASEVYTYNRTFYRQAVHNIPVALLSYIDTFTPAEEAKKPYWRTHADELYRLISWKEQLQRSFSQTN
ncbi:DUF5691 domain-containing protein [Dawidia soli]|uniref:Uncharacterized protein n=1 Tax=Dawidia soli TaxID=2782352 RepID=A0AAP2DBB7_9BACT|nr:DUF5691 domain-containing protein [Dawidia soli]MBT1688784.1 hypothetical protein [Dawidia soli]